MSRIPWIGSKAMERERTTMATRSVAVERRHHRRVAVVIEASNA